MKAFPVIHVEVSGVCNAKCPYCCAGSGSQSMGGFMEPEMFNDVLKRLVDTGLAQKGFTTFALYNWGEPFLHPKINEIIDMVNEFGFKYAFSTNASVVPVIDEAFTKNLDLAIISMPGFSKASYDKIHGFEFSMIKDNIINLVASLRKYDYSGEIRISYHVYQFNLEEMIACHEFCKSIGANFFPQYAILLDWWKLVDYYNNTIPVEKLKTMSRDLFMRCIDDEAYKTDKINRCPMIDNYIIINEYGYVVTCCNLPNNHPEYICGNLLKDDLAEILKEKTCKKICDECMTRGYYSGPLRVPAFYYQQSGI